MYSFIHPSIHQEQLSFNPNIEYSVEYQLGYSLEKNVNALSNPMFPAYIYT